MAVYKKNRRAYSLGQPISEIFSAPIVSQRAPKTSDQAEIGTCWVDQPNDDVYFLTSIVANSSLWMNGGGGGGSFDSLAVTNAAVIGGAVTLSTLATAGVVLNTAAGLLSTATGTDAQILMADTAAGLDFGEITSSGGSMVLTYPSAHTINIEATGGTANSYVVDTAGPVAPLVGVLDIVGYDTNITTDGNTANTVKVRLADDIVSVASVTASVDLTMASGTCYINSSTNAASSIALHANAGVNETILIYSDLGTSTQSVNLLSDVGGVSTRSGLAGANSVIINAFDAAGGIDVDYGTGGMTIDGANGAFTLQTGTGNILLGADSTDHDVAIGDDTGSNAMLLTAGTGHLIASSTGTMTFDAAGVLELNSSAGIIGIGNDAVAQNINIGTGAAQRVLAMGNASAASQIIVDCGTGGASFGASATAHTTTIGSGNTTSNLLLQAGTGSIVHTAGGIWDVNAVGAATIDSTGAAISIGAGDNNFAVNISTAGERITTVGNIVGNNSVVLNVGTGNLDLGVGATNHTTRLGSTSGTCATTIQSGTSAMTLTAGAALDANVATDITFDSAGGIFDVSVTGNVTIDSSAGTIGIGVDDIDQAINIGTNGERVITVGNQVGAAGVTVESGTAGMSLNAGGLLDIELLTDSDASAAVTINANNGYATFTGLTTAAGASQEFTITNSLCTSTSAIICTMANLGANDGQMGITRVFPDTGSFVVTGENFGAAAVNGNITITFWILSA